MKNNNHKIVQDLFPSYIDGLTTSETNEFIEEHIESCEECKKVLNEMKTTLQEENHIDLNDKKIKYAKKISRKLKFLEFLILMILLIIVGLVVDFDRKAIILRDLQSKGNQYLNYNNYLITIKYNGMNFIHRVYYKDGKCLSTDTSILENNVNSNNFIAVQNTKSYILNNIRQTFVYSAENEMISYQKDESVDINFPIETYASCRENYSKYLNNPLKVAIVSKIKSIIFDDVECYSIELKDSEDGIITMYFEKETGLLRKFNDEEYYYLFNFVNDSIFEVPEIPEKFVEE